VARGLSIERLREQRERIRELNERLAPFRILQGAEVNILSDGTLDYPDEILAELDLVIVSVHSAFDMPHPTGRLLTSRLPYEIDLDAVLDAAAHYGVAIEVNGQPDRLDLPDIWVQRAINRGILIACTSDAHSTRQLDNMRWSVATARRGWAEPRHVLNTRSLEELRTWLATHHRGAPAHRT
jgi:DNA polymerase (family 10)